ncbi:Protein of unknown function [Dyella sp. OK004]|uniref:DUF4019 domain-containing protein n=1 Tax=Dyella sp. OK004 TaxID=1855292 RepID=UPI0008E4D47E|nr:DUF4019 domain-containing protein [Dyella sp. OK004]SFR95058.1 Protein of unknown function [Dyella sp. OK004]
MRLPAKHVLAILFLAGCGACSAPQSSGQPSATQDEVSAGTEAQEQEAAAAAKAFFNELDADHMEETWANAGPALKATSTSLTWAATLQALRSASGKAITRKVKGYGFTHHLANAPPGEYVAIGFDTKFTNATAVEKVIFQKDQGQWKVVGYFLSKSFTAKL